MHEPATLLRIRSRTLASQTRGSSTRARHSIGCWSKCFVPAPRRWEPQADGRAAEQASQRIGSCTRLFGPAVSARIAGADVLAESGAGRMGACADSGVLPPVSGAALRGALTIHHSRRNCVAPRNRPQGDETSIPASELRSDEVGRESRTVAGERAEEVTELVACVLGHLSDNHEVIAADGRSPTSGHSGAGAFLNEYFTA